MHDPEVEQDCRAFSQLEQLVTHWPFTLSSSDHHVFGCAHKEMDLLASDFNWIAYFPYPEETPILLPDMDLPPMFGRAFTLGDILNNPAFDSLHTDLSHLQRFLRAQKIFRDERRQVAFAGGLHGFHLCTWLPLPTIPYSKDGIPMFDFVPSLTGPSWEPCGQIDLGSHSKVSRFWIANPIGSSSDSATQPGSSTDQLPTNAETVNTLSDPAVPTEKILFESKLDAFTAFCGEACFPVLYDYGSSLTLHPRSFRERIVQQGFRPTLIGSRIISTHGFTGEPIVGPVPIYEFKLRLWKDSAPVRIRSYEFPDYQTNIKTLLFGQVSI